jgi:hypothetical protein
MLARADSRRRLNTFADGRRKICEDVVAIDDFQRIEYEEIVE